MSTDYSPYILSLKECNDLGIDFPSVRMPNGEYRFRCMDQANGYGYILTKMPADSAGWQNSHYHKAVTETYIVQSGWIGFATIESDALKLRVLRPGEIVTTEIGIGHNVYLSAGTVIHTVKHGATAAGKDWFEHTELDNKTKPLDEPSILQLAA